jgi:archaemetzincin
MSTRSRTISFCVALICAALLTACTVAPKTVANTQIAPKPDASSPQIRIAMLKVAPFFKPMGKPQPADWLVSHNEPGETFDEYLASEPTVPTAERQTIYVLPLGKFSAAQSKVIDLAAGYLEVFFDLPVKRLPQRAFAPTYPHVRFNDLMHSRQVKTGYILNDVLPPILPEDGAALIAFTADDLYPDASMNYVFGQASFEKRVGVWSIFRLDDDASEAQFLRRVLKISAHETGHMFSMKHCTKYECVMSGTNHLGETDRRPIDACPECMGKICWLSKVHPAERFEKLAKFCRDHALTDEAGDFEKKAAAVR